MVVYVAAGYVAGGGAGGLTAASSSLTRASAVSARTASAAFSITRLPIVNRMRCSVSFMAFDVSFGCKLM